ncbi:MAG: molybdopterin adenylyltransferase [bacterium]|nr:molybdopterin adenylyltransferase [bacterium]
MITVGILTISDKGAKGEREDKSGQVIMELISPLNVQVTEYKIIPDEKEMIIDNLIRLVDELGCELVLTTGGTGLSPRDVTPEATKEVIEKEIPGFGEIMRTIGFKSTPHALLSRAMAGTRKQSLIINLPGSPKGVRECLELILPSIPHGIKVLKGQGQECGKASR